MSGIQRKVVSSEQVKRRTNHNGGIKNSQSVVTRPKTSTVQSSKTIKTGNKLKDKEEEFRCGYIMAKRNTIIIIQLLPNLSIVDTMF